MGFDKDKRAFGAKNFKYLDDLIHSGSKEIVLDSNIVLGDREESAYLEGIKLDVDNLVIDGNGHVMDAQGKTRIFYCTGKNIIIKNIILKNGFSKKEGGAIFLKELDEYEADSCTFKDNMPDDVSEYDSSIESEWISRKIVF